MNNHNIANVSVFINQQLISKQNSLKYFDIILDDRLSWKPQIEKFGNRTLQIMRNVVQIKTLYQHFSAQICLLGAFSFLFMYSIL